MSILSIASQARLMRTDPRSRRGLITGFGGGGGGGGGGGVTARYWRIRIIQGYQGLVTVAEVDMLSSGVSQIGGGTAFASGSSYASVPASAFDGSTSTWWGHNVVAGTTIGYDFGSPVAVDRVDITSRGGGDGGQCFKQGMVEYSDDGSAYTEAFPIFNNSTAYGASETRTFVNDYDHGAADRWRLLVVDTFTGGIAIGELQMRESLGGADTTSGQTFSQSSYFSTNDGQYAFDDNVATFWQSNGAANNSQWVSVQFSGNKTIEQIALQATSNGSYPQYMPKYGRMQRSTDGGSTWINCWWFIDTGSTYATSETRTWDRNT